jgi:Flp pilus assembly protein TadD
MGLTAKGQRKEYGKAVRRTEEEDREVLAKTPAGAAALQGNQQRAEELFLKAAAIDPSLAEPYFGLGALYQQQARAQEAVAAYRKYITLCRQPADMERAERRIAGIEDQLKAASKGGAK